MGLHGLIIVQPLIYYFLLLSAKTQKSINILPEAL